MHKNTSMNSRSAENKRVADKSPAEEKQSAEEAPPKLSEGTDDEPTAAKTTTPKKKAEDKQFFIYKLYDILATPDKLTSSSTRYEDIITWLPHGKGFIICDKGKFETEILPGFLPNTKYASYTRRLKRWKFVRVSSGVELGAYYHPQFQRGKPQLIKLISTDAQLLHDSMTQSYSAAGSMSTPLPLPSKSGRPYENFYADIRLPHSGISSSGAMSRSSSTAAPQGTTHADVRDFPRMMRQISKAKRKELVLTKRRESESGSNVDEDAADVAAAATLSAGFAHNMPGAGTASMSQFHPSSSYPNPTQWDPYTMMMHRQYQDASMGAGEWERYTMMMRQGIDSKTNAATGMSSSFNTSGMARYPSSQGHYPPMHPMMGQHHAASSAFDRYMQQQQGAAMMYGDPSAASNDPSLNSIAQDWMMMKQLQQHWKDSSAAGISENDLEQFAMKNGTGEGSGKEEEQSGKEEED